MSSVIFPETVSARIQPWLFTLSRQKQVKVRRVSVCTYYPIVEHSLRNDLMSHSTRNQIGCWTNWTLYWKRLFVDKHDPGLNCIINSVDQCFEYRELYDLFFIKSKRAKNYAELSRHKLSLLCYMQHRELSKYCVAETIIVFNLSFPFLGTEKRQISRIECCKNIFNYFLVTYINRIIKVILS